MSPAGARWAAFVTALIATWAEAQPASPSPELVERGAYLARAGDCVACHTERDAQPFAGGLAIVAPIGTIFSTNITPDLETGLGRYSLADFVKAMREGVAEDGERLYPAMPYPSYARLSLEDLSALYAYFTRGVKPVRQPNRETKLSWPLSMRCLLGVWDALFLAKGEYVADPDRSAAWNRGAYLVQGLGHCGECHTPRGFAGQMAGRSEKSGSRYLAGATLDNWHASGLAGDLETGLGAWSKDEVVEFLKTGRTARTGAVGVMAEVIAKSTQYLTDQDLLAMAEYLKSLPPSDRPRRSDSALPGADARATRALRAGDTSTRGAGVYLDNCNACHGSDGSGARRTFPNLGRNEAVNAQDPTSLIHVVLDGASMPATRSAPSALAMPDFAWRLSDEEVADVLTFVRSSWGNQAAPIDSEEVTRVRKALGVHASPSP